jgi:hypothetical protein
VLAFCGLTLGPWLLPARSCGGQAADAAAPAAGGAQAGCARGPAAPSRGVARRASGQRPARCHSPVVREEAPPTAWRAPGARVARCAAVPPRATAHGRRAAGAVGGACLRRPQATLTPPRGCAR